MSGLGQIWPIATQLSAITICDAPVHDSYLITTAVEASNRCDVEQKIHLKRALVGINHDVIFNVTSRDRASRKLHPAPEVERLEFLIAPKVST